MFRDLAEQSDRKGKFIDKEVLLKYFPLPGVLGERLFDLFDSDGSESIDFEEFFMGLAVIYNGSVEDRKQFLFNMYDLDGNGFISKEELSSLLTHIPAAFKVLRSIAEKGRNDLDVSEFQNVNSDALLKSHSESEPTPKPIELSRENRIALIVQSIFANQEDNVRRKVKDGLSYEEFCDCLERNAEITDLLNLFYDWGMPDLPVPPATLTPTLLHDKSTLFCGSSSSVRHDHGPRFLGLKLPLRPQKFFLLKSANPNSPQTYHDPGTEQDASTFHSNTGDQICSKGSIRSDKGLLEWRKAQLMELGLKEGDTSIEHEAARNASETIPLISGWLYKVGRRFNLKHYRFFVLRDRFLYYYAQASDPTPRKAIFLQDATISAVCNTERTHAYAFEILLPSGRTRKLYANNKRDRDIWIRALTKAARTSQFHDKYQLKSPRGQGKFAVVHRALKKRTQEQVAVKILIKDQIRKEDRQFLRTEAAVMRLIHHPNIVHLIDVYESTDFLYVVMEWISDGDVGSIRLPQHVDHSCRCDGWLPLRFNDESIIVTRHLVAERLAQIVAGGVLNGLSYLHRHNIIHRDLKPENILLSTKSSEYYTLAPSAIDMNHESQHIPAAKDCPYTSQRSLFQTEDCLASAGSEDPDNNGFAASSHLKRLTRCNGTKSIIDVTMHQEEYKHCECQACSTCTLFTKPLTVKITDFGLAKVLPPTGMALESLGTLSYAAPEVIRGDPYCQSVDLWSLGVVLFQLLSGENLLPFGGDEDDKIAEAVIRGQFTFLPHKSWAHISEHAKDFVTKLLQVDPRLRPSAKDCLIHKWIVESAF